MSSVLRAEGLVRSFKRRCVVDDVAIEVRQGEIVGLLGPNGAGKTTTFYMIVGLLKADRGRVYLDDRELTDWPMYRRARAGIGYLPQEASIFQKLTVEQNVMAILETLKLSRQERRDRLEQLLDELSIKHLRSNKAYSLSGGERRRLEITRALVTRPKFLLLDEPFTGVDPIAIDEIQRIVSDLRDKGLGVLITDHNVRETLSITDRAYLLFEGRILVQGAAGDLVDDPEARELYLGKDFRL
ncbi:LPS export ABC transporter ATP-binding protein [Candidatus Palauibacter sp.]|uniref:LPS export ABC transporter ATP-binding protein n=1 Tax=Candidatus Palauibacter sp. TaxID=3101350 RepID=UPI003AF23A16